MKDIILFEGDSQYGNYRVVDTFYNDRLARVLYGSDDTPQSGLATDDDPELLFNYNQRFLEIAQSLMPTSVLVIGGGAMTLPTALSRQLVDVKIDVVEIDPLLPDLARQFFGLDDELPINIIIEDGRKYIEQCQSKYDLIFVDVFHGNEIVEDLLSAPSAGLYASCLSDGGSVIVNFISKYHTSRPALTHQLVDNFGQVFESIDIYPADHHESRRSEQNLILVASSGQAPELDYLQSVTVDVTPARI